MRKANLLVSITLLVIFALSAQASAELKWELGAKGGVNWGKLTGDQLSLWLTGEDAQLAGSIGDNKTGFVGGIFAAAFFTEFFGVQVEAMYVQKGGQGIASGEMLYQEPGQNPNTVNFDGTAYLYLDYIEFPVLAVFNFDATDGSKVRLRGFLGPVFGFNMNAEVRLAGTISGEASDTSVQTQSIDERAEAGAYVKSFEMSLMFGGAVYWDIGNVDLILESRWETGLTTLDNTTLERDIKTSNINLMIGFCYPFGG